MKHDSISCERVTLISLATRALMKARPKAHISHKQVLTTTRGPLNKKREDRLNSSSSILRITRSIMGQWMRSGSRTQTKKLKPHCLRQHSSTSGGTASKIPTAISHSTSQLQNESMRQTDSHRAILRKRRKQKKEAAPEMHHSASARCEHGWDALSRIWNSSSK